MKEEKEFTKGQKIYGYYHHTWNVKKPMFGEIICKHPFLKEHHFAHKEICTWYWILFDGNLLPSLFPVTCIHSLEEYIESQKRWIGNEYAKGYQEKIKDNISVAKNFL